MDKHIKNIENNGYSLLENVFDESICNKVKSLSLKYIDNNNFSYDTRASSSSLARKDKEKILNNLQNKDYFYFNFISNKNICEIIGYFLKNGSYLNSEPFHLINSQVRCLEPNAPQQQLHMDSNLPGKDSYPLVMIVIIMIDDFTSKNGATRVVPSSHLRDDYAKSNKKYKNEVKILGKAGDVMIINGSLWHGSEKNFTNSERWSINLGYARWFIKPSFDIPRSIDKDIYNKMNKFERELMGLKTVPPIDEFDRLTRKSNRDFLHWEKK
tara:strand:+ start:617 stop:1423 length:807 start_codon:yes stop_codon:yes gene_type:complete